MTKRWRAAVAAAVLAVGGRGAIEARAEEEETPAPAAEKGLSVGERAPVVVASTWLNTEGGASPIEGAAETKVLMVEFWGTWCGPCVRSMPHVQELHERYGPRGLQVVGITRETADDVRAWVAERRYTFPIGCDPEQKTVKAFRFRGWPSTFLVDKEGSVAYVGDPYSVESAIEKALGLESGPGTLLGSYLDALAAKDAPGARGHLERLCEKAPAGFDLQAWARGALGADPPEAPAAKVDGGKALDACVSAAKTGQPANRAKALTPLAQSGPAEFDLESWARAAFGKAYPLTKAELAADLEASRFGTALDALLYRNPSGALLDLAAKNTGLVGYCKSKRGDLRADARRALMAIRYVFTDKPMKDMDEKAQERFWEDMSVSGMAFDEERKKILGILIGGRMVMQDQAAGYVRRQLSLHALMTSLVDGKPLKPAAAAARAKKEEEDIVAELGRTY